MSRAPDMQAIKARLAAATPGPWTTTHKIVSLGLGRCGVADFVVIGGQEITVGHQDWITGDVVREPYGNGMVRETVVNKKPYDPKPNPDAELIAHAHADLAALVAEVESLQLKYKATAEQRDMLNDASVAKDRRVEVLEGALREFKWLYEHQQRDGIIRAIPNEMGQRARAALQSSAHEGEK